MKTLEAGKRYDSYWSERDLEVTRQRSRGRARLAVELLRSPQGVSDGARLVEVGCGPGFALEVFREAGFDASGVDVSEEAIRCAREVGLPVDVIDLESGELDWGSPEVVAALEVLEHLVDPLAALRRLGEALGENGRLIVSLPNEIHILRRLGILFGRMGFGGHDDPHLHHFDDSSARRLFEAAGFQVVGCRHDCVVPPRHSLLRALAAPGHALFPRLFSISHVYLLQRVGEGGAS